jgi:hypothetical protein
MTHKTQLTPLEMSSRHGFVDRPIQCMSRAYCVSFRSYVYCSEVIGFSVGNNGELAITAA